MCKVPSPNWPVGPKGTDLLSIAVLPPPREEKQDMTVLPPHEARRHPGGKAGVMLHLDTKHILLATITES